MPAGRNLSGALRQTLTRRTLVSGSMAAMLLMAPGVAGNAQVATPETTREVVDTMGPVIVPSRPQRVIANNNATIGNMLALGMKPIGADYNTHSIPRYFGDQMTGIVDVTAEDGIDIEKALALDPDLIIAVRHHHIGNMLALGVTPIGIVADASEFPFPGHVEALAGVANVRAETDWMLDVEKALALNPDLILEMSGQEGEPWNQETCDLAKNVAPTACFPYGYTHEDEIKQNMLDVGVALGMEGEAAEIIADFDARLAELRSVVAQDEVGERPVAHVTWQGDGNFFVPVDRPSNMILRSLDIPQLDFQAVPTSDEVAFSFENVDLLNEAHTVIVLMEGAGTQEELESQAVWQLIEPVKEGRTLFLDANLWGWDYMPALMSMLDDVEQRLLPLITA